MQFSHHQCCVCDARVGSTASRLLRDGKWMSTAILQHPLFFFSWIQKINKRLDKKEGKYIQNGRSAKIIWLWFDPPAMQRSRWVLLIFMGGSFPLEDWLLGPPASSPWCRGRLRFDVIIRLAELLRALCISLSSLWNPNFHPGLAERECSLRASLWCNCR